MLERQHVRMRASVVISQSSRRLSFVFPRLNLWKNKDYQVHAVSSWLTDQEPLTTTLHLQNWRKYVMFIRNVKTGVGDIIPNILARGMIYAFTPPEICLCHNQQLYNAYAQSILSNMSLLISLFNSKIMSTRRKSASKRFLEPSRLPP